MKKSVRWSIKALDALKASLPGLAAGDAKAYEELIWTSAFRSCHADDRQLPARIRGGASYVPFVGNGSAE